VKTLVPPRVVSKAIETALGGVGTGTRRCYRVGAVLFNRRGILRAKSNSYKTHPLVLRYSEFPYLHAEAHCLVSHGLDNCEGLDLCVVRVHKDDRTLSMAKPCDACANLLSYSKVNNVYYSDWSGAIKCL